MMDETAHLLAPTSPATKPMAMQPATKTRNTMFRLLKEEGSMIFMPGM